MQIVLVQSTNTQSMTAEGKSRNHGPRGESVANLSIFGILQLYQNSYAFGTSHMSAEIFV